MLVTHQPDTIDFTIPTLDDPAAVAPGFHIWRRSRIPWFDTADSMPRHDRFRPDTVGLTETVAAGAPIGRSPLPDNVWFLTRWTYPAFSMTAPTAAIRSTSS
jgi:hypothetical protein